MDAALPYGCVADLLCNIPRESTQTGGTCQRCPNSQRACGDRCAMSCLDDGGTDTLDGDVVADATDAVTDAEASTDADATMDTVEDGDSGDVAEASTDGDATPDVVCPGTGLTFCEGVGCVNLQTNSEHCGACPNACMPGMTCVSGRCDCGASGLSYCSAVMRCLDLQTDNNNCGACGRTCTGGKLCTAGACRCPTGTVDCSGTCINVTASDNANCGACGRACSGGQTCVSGTCTCPTGQTFCAGTCTNTLTDNNNCGPAGATSCARVCGAGTRCSAGACVTTCPTGQTDCTSVGAGCVNTNTSLEHCGGCGMACSSVGGTSTCASGACRITCNSGVGNCDGNALNGCEQTLNTLSHCGGCGMPCNATRIANGTAFTCTTGTCRVTDCGTNFIPNTGGTACIACGANMQPVCSSPDPPCQSGSTANPLTSSPQTCTLCGASTQPACSFVPVCGLGLWACTVTVTGVTFDICYNLQTQADHCGSCTGTCMGAPNSNGTCSSGKCVCTGYSGDCDSNRANGCETNLNTDDNNCGACGTVCSGATPRCVSGFCTT